MKRKSEGITASGANQATHAEPSAPSKNVQVPQAPAPQVQSQQMPMSPGTPAGTQGMTRSPQGAGGGKREKRGRKAQKERASRPDNTAGQPCNCAMMGGCCGGCCVLGCGGGDGSCGLGSNPSNRSSPGGGCGCGACGQLAAAGGQLGVCAACSGPGPCGPCGCGGCNQMGQMGNAMACGGWATVEATAGHLAVEVAVGPATRVARAPAVEAVAHVAEATAKAVEEVVRAVEVAARAAASSVAVVAVTHVVVCHVVALAVFHALKHLAAPPVAQPEVACRATVVQQLDVMVGHVGHHATAWTPQTFEATAWRVLSGCHVWRNTLRMQQLEASEALQGWNEGGLGIAMKVTAQQWLRRLQFPRLKNGAPPPVPDSRALKDGPDSRVLKDGPGLRATAPTA
eukprot:s441_g25.t1